MKSYKQNRVYSQRWAMNQTIHKMRILTINVYLVMLEATIFYQNPEGASIGQIKENSVQRNSCFFTTDLDLTNGIEVEVLRFALLRQTLTCITASFQIMTLRMKRDCLRYILDKVKTIRTSCLP